MTRASTGIRGLDVVLGGGFPGRRAVLVCGGPGTGKTTMALQFLLEGVREGEPGALLSLDQKPRHLVEDAAALGWNLEDPLAAGRLTVLDGAPFFTALRGRRWVREAVDARQVAADLARPLRQTGAKRFAIDSLTSLVPADLPRGQAEDYIRSLIESLEDNAGCTTLLTCRGGRLDPQGRCEAARSLASGWIELRMTREGRTLRVRKMRGTSVEPEAHAMTIQAGTGLSLLVPARAGRFRHAPALSVAAPPPSDRPAAV